MSTARVALCADRACLQHPEIMGLDAENLFAQSWLQIFTSAEEARDCLKSNYAINEVWVFSNEKIAPVNLAATLKRDRSDRFVCMISPQETGSLKSRVSAAGIDATLSQQAFVARYLLYKQQGDASLVNPAVARVSQQDFINTGQRQGASFADVGKSASLARSLYTEVDDSQKKSAFILPVVSGSGGAGKSTISVLLALASQKFGLNTLLLDFDLQFGDSEHLLGIKQPLRIDEVIAAPARMTQLKSSEGVPAVLAAPSRLEDAEAVMQEADRMIEQLKGNFDVIVCNTGAAWAEQHAVLLENSSKALFLIDQRPSSLRACKHALELCARCGIASTPFMFGLNRCGKKARLTSIDASYALQGAHVVELMEGGLEVEESLDEGLARDLMESGNELCESVEKILLDILPNAHELVLEEKDKEKLFALPLFGSNKQKRRKR